ncbi:oxidoreductase [Halobacteriovorax sp. JY17]|uniref:oxidoreductase n=1 Tax=Halobacteriovorax sp. JY17 TaxID=2014617 RepID=UPI000C68E58E|nr:oxidoreductase [Halobacteriovorax sp. JY17]PIK13642.1 MAG: short-chain dehydrogenase [Halobacteriovorax sp. JY17]
MKNAIVTGANIGLGLETVKGLLQEGFHVTMACRNEEKTSSAITKLKKEYPSSKIDFMKLDLNDLSSVKSFAENFAKSSSKLDLLVNNAGIMMPPFSLTANGFESQLGVNYLSHFALTGLLFDLLKKSEDARVISLASLAHKWGDIYFQDLNFKGKYNKKKAYGQSKLACLMFAYEFDRRLKEKNIKILSVAAHPGVSSTNLGQFMPKFMSFGMGLISQSATDGARPTLYAALNTELVGGEYIGPNGLGEMKGEPTKVDSNKASKNLVVAKKLWEVSEELTGVSFL